MRKRKKGGSSKAPRPEAFEKVLTCARVCHLGMTFEQATKPEEATGKFKTKLSATGLVYKHFGKEILATLCPGVEGARLDAVYAKLYSVMIEGIDAIDNGVEASAGEAGAGVRRECLGRRGVQCCAVLRVRRATAAHRDYAVYHACAPLRPLPRRPACACERVLEPPARRQHAAGSATPSGVAAEVLRAPRSGLRRS